MEIVMGTTEIKIVHGALAKQVAQVILSATEILKWMDMMPENFVFHNGLDEDCLYFQDEEYHLLISEFGKNRGYSYAIYSRVYKNVSVLEIEKKYGITIYK
jgi:hypothetical protein